VVGVCCQLDQRTDLPSGTSSPRRSGPQGCQDGVFGRHTDLGPGEPEGNQGLEGCLEVPFPASSDMALAGTQVPTSGPTREGIDPRGSPPTVAPRSGASDSPPRFAKAANQGARKTRSRTVFQESVPVLLLCCETADVIPRPHRTRPAFVQTLFAALTVEALSPRNFITLGASSLLACFPFMASAPYLPDFLQSPGASREPL